jgi:hypothetical protein
VHALRRILVVLVLAASALMITASRPAWACSCAQIDPLESAELAFTGVATSVRQPWFSDEVTVHFAVESVQKGATGDETELTTHSQGPACGYPFTEGHRYHVYTDGQETTSCDGNEDLGLAGTQTSKTPVALWTATAAAITLAAAALVFIYRRRRS